MKYLKENFKPIKNDPPTSLMLKIKFFLRLLLDFQTYTLYRDLRNFLKSASGKILDIGCGNSPYEHLVNKNSRYFGIDINDQIKFDYNNKKIVRFDGSRIPFANRYFQSFICTEVLEHVVDPVVLISEMKRILKSGGTGLVSIPWSARFHYIPYDYYRYTPSALKILFRRFNAVKIEPRGSDITVICSKIIVSVAGSLRNCRGPYLIFLPIILLLAIPIVTICLIIGHLSVIFNLGSKNDPLGYTIYLSK